MNFQFFSPTKLSVGAGKVSTAGKETRIYGTSAFVVSGRSAIRNGYLHKVLNSLRNAGLDTFSYQKPEGEPTVEMVDQAVQEARKTGCNAVVSIGGGSVIDLAKAVCGLVTNGGSVEEYLEGVGTGLEITVRALPHIAIPTTAGTGAEVTRNAVISSQTKHFKKSFRHPSLYPVVAILDAELCMDLPPKQTSYSGMDAITQLIESYLSRKATPITDALALYGLRLSFRSIRQAVLNGTSLEAREDMLLASTISGICLANAGLGMAHGFAAGLGALYDVPHGKACAILLPYAIRVNNEAAQNKIATIGRLLCDFESLPMREASKLAIAEIEKLNAELYIPGDLKEFQIPQEEYDTVVRMSMGNSMSGNPVEITPERARAILESIA